CGDPPVHFRPLRRAGADYRFLIFPPGRVTAVDFPPDIRANLDILDAELLLSPLDHVKPLQTTSDRSGFVVSRGRDRAAAVAAANFASQRITVTYEDGSWSRPLPLAIAEEVPS